VDPPTACWGCGNSLTGAQGAGTAWSQVWAVKVIPWRIEYLLPRRACSCGTTTTAAVPSGGPVMGICYGPVLNTMAIALTAFGNVPTERSAQLVGMLTGQGVSAGLVDKADARLAAALTAAGFEDAMQSALMAEPVLTADESPVEVVTPATDPDTGAAVPGAPHVFVLRTPDERLVRVTALDSRRHEEVIASLRTFTGYLIVDGYGAYQELLPAPDDHAREAASPDGDGNEQMRPGGLLAEIQQCCQHVTRRCRGVAKLGPGLLQSWATKVIAVLGDAHDAVQAARASGDDALDPQVLAGLRARYDTAVATGITHNRHRDWHDGNHPGYALASWLHAHVDQVWLYHPVRRRLDLPRRRTRSQTRQATSSRLRILADRPDPGPMVPDQLLSDLARNHGLTVLDAIPVRSSAGPGDPPPDP
jgi:transposase